MQTAEPLDLTDALAALEAGADADPRTRALLRMDVLRAHLLRLRPGPGAWEGTKAIRGLYAEIAEAFGADSPLARFVDAAELVADGNLPRVVRRLDSWQRDHGADDPAGLELEAWAAMTLRKWPADRRRRTAELLAASPRFGPDHLYTLVLRDDLATLRARLEDLPVTLRRAVCGPLSLRDRLAASLVADGRVADGVFEYALLARLLADEGHDQRAWAARVAGLRAADDSVEARRLLRLETLDLLPAGRDALGVDHPLIAAATALCGPPADPVLRLTTADVPPSLLGDAEGPDLEAWHAYLSLWTSRLGDPHLVWGPTASFRWYLAEGGALDLQPRRWGDSTWSCEARLLDVEALARFNEEVYHESRWGEGSDESVYLWYLQPPGAPLPGGQVLHDGFRAERWDAAVSLLGTTVEGLGADLSLMPREWAQVAVIEWAGPGSTRARLEITAAHVVVVIDHATVHDAPSAEPSALGEAIRLFAAPFRGTGARGRTERRGWFRHAEHSTITAG